MNIDTSRSVNFVEFLLRLTNNCTKHLQFQDSTLATSKNY